MVAFTMYQRPLPRDSSLILFFFFLSYLFPRTSPGSIALEPTELSPHSERLKRPRVRRNRGVSGTRLFCLFVSLLPKSSSRTVTVSSELQCWRSQCRERMARPISNSESESTRDPGAIHGPFGRLHSTSSAVNSRMRRPISLQAETDY